MGCSPEAKFSVAKSNYNVEDYRNIESQIQQPIDVDFEDEITEIILECFNEICKIHIDDLTELSEVLQQLSQVFSELDNIRFRRLLIDIYIQERQKEHKVVDDDFMVYNSYVMNKIEVQIYQNEELIDQYEISQIQLKFKEDFYNHEHCSFLAKQILGLGYSSKASISDMVSCLQICKYLFDLVLNPDFIQTKLHALFKKVTNIITPEAETKLIKYNNEQFNEYIEQFENNKQFGPKKLLTAFQEDINEYFQYLNECIQKNNFGITDQHLNISLNDQWSIFDQTNIRILRNQLKLGGKKFILHYFADQSQ